MRFCATNSYSAFNRLTIASDAIVNRFNHNLVGVRWRLGDTSSDRKASGSIKPWIPQRLRAILGQNEFPETKPYDEGWRARFTQQTERIVESLFPDGSYFGIGAVSRIGCAKSIQESQILQLETCTDNLIRQANRCHHGEMRYSNTSPPPLLTSYPRG